MTREETIDNKNFLQLIKKANTERIKNIPQDISQRACGCLLEGRKRGIRNDKRKRKGNQ